MSWSSWTSSIKQIAKEAQRGIDLVLDINEQEAAAAKREAGASLDAPNESLNDDELEKENFNFETPQETIEIGAENNQNHTLKKPTTNGKSDHNEWGDPEWAHSWSDSKTPVKVAKNITKKKSAKTSPRTSTRRQEKIQKEESVQNGPTNGQAEPEPIQKVEKLVKTEEIEPVVQSKSEEVPEINSSNPKVKSSKSGDKTFEPEVNSIKPEVTPEFEDHSEKINYLTEHSENLGNSFHKMTQQLYSREQQLILLSTTNAQLQADNDDLLDKNNYLQEQLKNQSIAQKSTTETLNTYNKKIELALSKMIQIFIGHFLKKTSSYGHTPKRIFWELL